MLNIVATCWNIVVLFEYSFNFCWSATTHFRAKLKWRTRECCCRFVLQALSPLEQQGNSQLMRRRNHGDSRQHGKLSPELARIYSLVVPKCNLYQSFVSHVTTFVILRSYIVQARKSLALIAGSVDWCYQNSWWTLLSPTLRPPCWYFHKTTWHQTRKLLVEAVQQAATCWRE